LAELALEPAKVTDADLTAISTGIALGQHLTDVIRMLEPDLTTFDRAAATRGVTLQELAWLGQALNSFGVVAAPIAASSRTNDPAQLQWNQRQLTISSPIQTHVGHSRTMRPATFSSTSPSARKRSLLPSADSEPSFGATVRQSAWPASTVAQGRAIPAATAKPTPRRVAMSPMSGPVESDEPRSVPGDAGLHHPDLPEAVGPAAPAVDAPQLPAATSLMSANAFPEPLAIAALTSIAAFPADAGSNAPLATPDWQPPTEMTHRTVEFPSEDGFMPIRFEATLPAMPDEPLLASTQADALPSSGDRSFPTGSVAIVSQRLYAAGIQITPPPDPVTTSQTPLADSRTAYRTPLATSPMPYKMTAEGLDDIRSGHAVPETTITTDRVAEPVLQSTQLPPAMSEGDAPQGEAGSRHGMILVDARQMGRWIIDQLEHYASRPAAMTTGIDPRMNATYPGAPTGV
jgi:hypothetical protein